MTFQYLLLIKSGQLKPKSHPILSGVVLESPGNQPYHPELLQKQE